MFKQNMRRGLGILSLLLICGNGCQMGGAVSRVSSTQHLESTPTAKLGNRQVADVQIASAQVLEKRGETAQALAKYMDAFAKDATRGDAALHAAVLLDRQAKLVEAEEWYRKARVAQPKNADIPCSRGYGLYLRQKFEEAEKEFRQALALQPDHARAHNNLGLLLAQTGRTEDAMTEFRNGGNNEGDAHANVGFALSLRGELAQAKAHYMLALNADPHSKESRQALQELDQLIARQEGTALVAATER